MKRIVALLLIVLMNTQPITEVKGDYELKRKEAKALPVTEYIEMPVHENSDFKAWMDGCAITDYSSRAYSQLRKMTIDENGVYSDGEYKAVAMAAFYGKVGDKFRFTLSSGQVFYGVMTDIKQDAHVDSYYRDSNQGLIEFVVDTNSLTYMALVTGSLNCVYEGKVIRIEREL